MWQTNQISTSYTKFAGIISPKQISFTLNEDVYVNRLESVFFDM